MNNIIPGSLPSSYIPETPSTLDAGNDLAGGASFTDVLQSAVSAVNQTHDTAAAQVANLLHGSGDMNSVMIAVEKADVSFELMMQVRNKIVSAYQDIEKMQF